MNRQFAAIACVSMIVSSHFDSSQAFADSGEAEQLFRDGKKLMGEGSYDRACVAFEASQALDPGINTLLNLANCREKNGQLATAWSLFLDAEALAGAGKNDGLLRTARERAVALESRVSHLTINVPAETRVAGLKITRNGETLDGKLWDQRLPFDGGSITIVATAPGHEDWQTTIELATETGHEVIEVPPLAESKVAKQTGPALVTEPDKSTATEIERAVSRAGWMTGRRKTAIGVGTFGVVALGVAGALGYQAGGLEDDAARLCPEVDCGDADEANALLDRGRSRALWANIGFGVSAAALISAGVLWLTGAPTEAKTQVSVRITPDPGVDVAVHW